RLVLTEETSGAALAQQEVDHGLRNSTRSSQCDDADGLADRVAEVSGALIAQATSFRTRRNDHAESPTPQVETTVLLRILAHDLGEQQSLRRGSGETITPESGVVVDVAPHRLVEPRQLGGRAASCNERQTGINRDPPVIEVERHVVQATLAELSGE